MVRMDPFGSFWLFTIVPIIYLIIIIFIIWLIIRFVRAHEKIAEGINNIEEAIRSNNYK